MPQDAPRQSSQEQAAVPLGKRLYNQDNNLANRSKMSLPQCAGCTQISIGLGLGLLICRIVEPSVVGMNGA